MFNWHDCELSGQRLEQQSDCRPFRPRKDVQPRSEIALMFDEAFNRLYKRKYDVSVVYTDAIRRAAELYGPFSNEVFKAMNSIDDVMQGILTDIQSKSEKFGLEVRNE